MEFSSDINLTQRAAIAVVSSLWNQADIITEIENLILSCDNAFKNWKDIELKVYSLLKKLELPIELKLKLENLLQPMGRQICKWMSYTCISCNANPSFSKSIMFFWTERGTLNYIKTTRWIIDCCTDNTLRFYLACTFCTEDIILKLWPDLRHNLLERVTTYPFFINMMSVMYWVHFLNGSVEDLMALYEYTGEKNDSAFAFYAKLDDRCITSMNYFLLQIQPEKRQRLILIAIQKILSKRPHDGNVLLYLFSHLNEEEVAQIVNKNSYPVLASLLDWPCTEYFMAVANSSWSNLSNSNYINLFQNIVEFVSEYNIGDIYENLAKEFWKKAPVSIRKYTIERCVSGTFLSRLIMYEDTDNIIQMILNDCTPNERQQIILYTEGLKACEYLVRKERWNSLKLFLKSCISSRVTLDEFMTLYSNNEFCNYEAAALRTANFFKVIKEWYH